MGSYEQACADTERAALAAVQATKAQLKEATALVKAAVDGDIARIRRSSERLQTAAGAARQAVANAQQAWPFTPEEEESILGGDYEEELLQAASADHLSLRRQEGRLLAFPVVVRVLPGARAVQVDKNRLTVLRPTRLVSVLKQLTARKPKLSPERFIETLHDAYRLVVGDGADAGGGTTLARVYDALTVMPDVRREYSRTDFTRDLFLLDRSGVTHTKSGARLDLPAATGTKGGGRVFEFVDQSGEPVTYYGIRFSG